jgi:broad specificity phosphatase PhoE
MDNQTQRASVPPAQLYWVRHGENRANLMRELSHRKVDYPLSPKGLLQAQQTARWFANRPLAAVYSSPLARAVQTAWPIASARGLAVTVIEELRELNVGYLEDDPASQASWDQYMHVVGQWTAGHRDVRFPGGESYRELWRRASSALARITRDCAGRSAVAVGHGGMLMAIVNDLCPALDRTFLNGRECRNASITQFTCRITSDQPTADLLSWANTDHLSGDAVPKPSLTALMAPDAAAQSVR